MPRIPAALLCCLAALAFAVRAHAEPPAPAYSWTGFYIGAHAGYYDGQPQYTEEGQDSNRGHDRNPHVDGFIGGLYTGFNYQLDPVVLGAEADGGAGWLRQQDHKDVDSHDMNDYTAFETNWNAHFRGRVGFTPGRFCDLLDHTLFYAAGGLALTSTTVDDTDHDYGRDRRTWTGWTVGGGIEQAITEHIVIRAEYLYDNFGSKTHSFEDPEYDYDYAGKSEPFSHTIRGGIAFKF